MLIFELLKRIKDLTGVERKYLTPVKFGYDVAWLNAEDYVLAQQNVPATQCLLVARVECYTTNLNSGATDFMLHQVTPPGTAYWFGSSDFVFGGLATGTPLTETNAEAHVILDTDDLLLFGGNQYVKLVGALSATPDTTTRRVRTTCYGFYAPFRLFNKLRNQFTWANQPT